MQLVVHGGAGREPAEPPARQAALDRAAASGAEEATALDAVERALRALESDPRFNAGVGGAVQADGVVRTDAGLMTDDRTVGAACAMPGVEHAVSAARVVAEETPHVLLAGGHAVDLAGAYGVETGADLLTDATRRRYERADPPPAEADARERVTWVRERFGAAAHGSAVGPTPPGDHDTVGAVAGDGECFAAATSTAGRWFALAGRVGDVPQVGSGFYCSPAGGASATGAGEDIARVTLSRLAVQGLEDGQTAQRAADRAITEFDDLTDSVAGVVVLGPDGPASAHTAEAMQTSIADSG